MEERRSTWSDSLLSYVKPYANKLFYIFSHKYFVFYILYYRFLSAGKACVTQNNDFPTLCLEMLFSEMLWQVDMKLEVTFWRKTQATVRTDLEHISNLLGLFLNDLEKETAVSFHRVWYGWLEKRSSIYMLNLDLWFTIVSVLSGLRIGAMFFGIFSWLQSNLSFFKPASTVWSTKLEKNTRSFVSFIGLTAQFVSFWKSKHLHDLHHLWFSSIPSSDFD